MIPSTSSSMSNDDHRIRATPIAGVLAAAAAAAYAFPALTGAWPALRGPPGRGGHHRERARLRAHVRRRASPRARPRCSRSSPGTGCARPSSSSASRSAETRRWHARSPTRDTRSPSTATATATCCVWRRGRSARTSPRTRHDPGGDGPRAELYRPPYGILNAAALQNARGRGCGRCCEHWGGTGRRRRRPSRSTTPHDGGTVEGRCCCCTSRRLLGAGVLAAHRPALPRVLESWRSGGSARRR